MEATHAFPVPGTFPDCYEMIIIHTGFPALKIDSKDFHTWMHSAELINPGQSHSLRPNGPCRMYSPFFLEAEFINSVARSIGGKGNVLFFSGGFDLPGEILHLARLFLTEADSTLPGRDLTVGSLENMLAVAMLRHFPNNQRLNSDLIPKRDQHSIDRVKEFMHEHFQQNLNLDQLARVANYSNFHFIRFFKNATGKTPFDYLMDIKIEKASEMLKRKDLTVTEVCYACGFTNPSHFTTVFKRKKGVTPSKFQRLS